MTNEELRQNAAAMLAHADGKPVECASKHAEDWSTLGKFTPTWEFSYSRYRPALEPQTPKPWDCPEDVPPLCWIRAAGTDTAILVTEVRPDGISSAGGKGIRYLFADYEYSTTRKPDDWHPCTKR